jgi:phosphoglycolate phosphatase-like HAD superfamily hydrolase
LPGEGRVLLLFDVDGTLVRGATEAHAEALHRALRAVHGVDTAAIPVVSPAGRTDPEIARVLLLEAGVSAEQIADRADEVRSVCCAEYGRLCPDDLSAFVLPGIPALLARLAGVDGLRLSLVTGNYEPVARLKLARAGIGDWFPRGQGGFGSDSEDRAALPRIARRRAGADGVAYPRKRTIVIGDTPRDIACAHADGVRCFAVTTGPYGAEALQGADAVARDAEELGELLLKAVSA